MSNPVLMILYAGGHEEYRDCTLDEDGQPDFKELRDTIGGYVEVTAAKGPLKRRKMYVDEDGFMKRLPVNLSATMLHERGTTIVGPAIILLEEGL